MSAIDHDGIFNRKLAEILAEIEPCSFPSNIAARHTFLLKIAFTGSKIFVEQYCQQTTLHTDRILRLESFRKTLDRVNL